MGKGTGSFKQLRNLAKTICFASLYGASPPKVHEIISRAEDSDGNMLYAHYNLRQIRALHRRWLQQAPEFKAWWDKTMRTWRAAVVAMSMIDLGENHSPFDFGQKTGLVNQLHDAVLFAVPERDADNVKQIVTEVLTRQVDGLPVTFTAEAAIGTNWRET